MDRFNMIKNDEEIIQIYNQIAKNEDKNKAWAHHDLLHVSNVAELVEKLLYNLNYDDDLIEEAKIAAILHDVGCLEGKDGHALRSYEYAREYLKNKDLELKYEELQFIKDILIDIHNNILEINFICDDKINKKELEEFYFMAKVFKAIKSFSKKMNLMPIVLLNHEKWDNKNF